MFWFGLLILAVVGAAIATAVWRRGYTVEELVRRPPKQADLTEVVNILGYLHHELIKHRLPLVRTVADTAFEDVVSADLAMMREAVSGTSGRASLVGELEGYLAGLRRAAGTVHLNYRRDPLVRRVRKACRVIQAVAEGLDDGRRLTAREHRRLQWADTTLSEWFRPRLVALRSSVLTLEITRSIFVEPVARVVHELGVADVQVRLPEVTEPVLVRMLHPDFNLVVRNLVRNGLQRSIQSSGEPRVAVEIQTRMELTGEESVLVSVHDTDPTILTREELYGGALGRGLNIVTTTLRRYDAALRCVGSTRDGFAKRMEVRLFLAAPHSEAFAMPQGGRLSGWQVPLAALGGVLAVGVICTLGWTGTIPDPLKAMGLSINGALPPDPVVVQSTRNRASLVVFEAVAAADDDARRQAFALRPDLARGRVPGAESIQVDRSRCAPPQRIVSERRVEVDCHLLKPDLRLGHPVLNFRVEGDYDPSGLEHIVRELVIEGDTTRTLKPTESCIQVTPVAKGENLPPPAEARGPDKRPKKASSGRLVVDYSRCLLVPRYPLRVQIRLQRPKGSPRAPTDDARYQPVNLDVRVRLRRVEDGHDAYARIHNDRSVLPDKANRHALSGVIAQRVSRVLEGSWEPGTMPVDLQKHLARALYIGWVRSSLFKGIWARIEARKQRKPPDDETCALAGDVQLGFARISRLDPKVVRGDLFRSQYFALHADLWISGDVAGSIESFDDFQLKASRQTDFVQGARLYLAVLLASVNEPGTVDGAGVDDVLVRLERVRKLLTDLQKHAKKPPRRGKDYLYDRIKLMGVEHVLEQEGDEGYSVNDMLCAWRLARPGWASALQDDTRGKLFGHCPSYVTTQVVDGDVRPAPDLDLPGDAGGLGEAPSPKPPTPSIDRARRYLLAFMELIQDSSWRCESRAP